MAQGDNPKKVFVAATMQDQGKTTVCLGLMAAFQRRRPPVCFMKPVGQRYVELDGARVDEDVALLNAIFPSGAALGDMSPVTVGRSFTRDYIRHPRGEALTRRIADAFARLSAGKGFVVIEGTGHAGVGSCFDTSNADVAALLGAKVILVTSGGIGKPIDEVMLNESLFRDRGCEMLGVVLNKVLPEKLEEIRQVVAAGLGRKGIALLGCIPYEPLLANPTMQHVFEELPCEALCGADRLHNIFDSVVVGAMAAPRAMMYVEPGCLLITPGDREDLLEAVVDSDKGPAMSGVLLTGGTRPHPLVMRRFEAAGLPVLLVDSDSYTAAAAVHGLKVKILPADGAKIAAGRRIVSEHVDLDRIMEKA